MTDTAAYEASWAESYTALGERIAEQAPHAAPLLAGFNVCVDHVYRMTAGRIAALAEAADDGGSGGATAARVLERMAHGRGGELVRIWPGGTDWADAVLGRPDRAQPGGTGPQAAWSLAVLGAAGVIPLLDRSPRQLSVLHPDLLLCTADGGTRTVGQTAAGATGETATDPAIAGRQPHAILEFTAGTPVPGVPEGIARSSRIILRFTEDGIERDDAFARQAAALAAGAGAGLLSGLNALPAHGSTAEHTWLRDVLHGWRQGELPLLHLELAEFTAVEELREGCARYAPLADSLGMSLSELAMLTGPRARTAPAAAAADLARAHGLDRVCVHADDWALAVHRGDPDRQRTALMTGSLLAAARAAEGAPAARPLPPPGARYTADRPPDGPLGGGLRADCVPAPHLTRPTATIGLGDTFTGGLLLAHALPVSRAAPLGRLP